MSQPKFQTRKIANDAHFPTAQLVACQRAYDAESPSPSIGSNVGAGPDLAAAAFCGETGRSFSAELAALFGITTLEGAGTMILRTMYFDKQWMDAHAAGCRQFVILASGLDARAWRLPLDASCTVFEVDVPAAFAYKDERIKLLPPSYSSTTCRRVAVSADLAQGDWAQKLVNAGFDPSQRSFFLNEGLLFYLPSSKAVEDLFKKTASLMSNGSMLAGDCPVNVLNSDMYALCDPIMKKYGTGWTFDMGTVDALIHMLESYALQVQERPTEVAVNMEVVVQKDWEYVVFAAEKRASRL